MKNNYYFSWLKLKINLKQQANVEFILIKYQINFHNQKQLNDNLFVQKHVREYIFTKTTFF